MRFSTVLALAGTIIPILAQNFSSTSVTEQSPDFNLVIQSRVKTLDGRLLGACHNGAAHEGLCIVDGSFSYTSSYVNYQFNTTRSICTESNSTGAFTIPCSSTPVDPTLTTGILTWWLIFDQDSGSAGRVSQSMYLDYVPWSNVALAQIGFPNFEGDGQYVAFDKNGLMNIQQFTDDTLEPGSEYLQTVRPLYRWLICQTYYSGYHYTALTWVLGSHSPQNPTCEKVNVKRVFV